MRLLKKNLKKVYYALYQGKESAVDEAGFYTGEPKIIYSKPKSIEASVSASAGNITMEGFGVNENYDKVLIIEGTKCPIDEYSKLWIENPVKAEADYSVKRVSKSLNYTVIGCERVKTDGANNSRH